MKQASEMMEHILLNQKYDYIYLMNLISPDFLSLQIFMYFVIRGRIIKIKGTLCNFLHWFQQCNDQLDMEMCIFGLRIDLGEDLTYLNHMFCCL